MACKRTKCCHVRGVMVVIASFMVFAITDGVSRAFGVFYIKFLKEFGTTKSTTAWVGSFQLGASLLVGPVSGVLVNKFGCRTVTVLGAALACLSCVVSAFTQSLFQLVCTYGFLTGASFGLMYLPANVIINLHFNRHRGLATGLASSGSGIGALALAPLTALCVRWYGWRGAMLLVGGVVLQAVVCGALMWEPIHSESDACADDMGRSERNQHKAGTFPSGDENKVTKDSAVTFGDENDSVATTVISSEFIGSPKQSYDANGIASNIRHEDGDDNSRNKGSKLITKDDSNKTCITEDIDNLTKGSCNEILQGTSSVHFGNFLRVLGEPHYLLFLLSNTLTSTGFDVPFLYIVDRANELGVPLQRASTLLSCLGLAGTVGGLAYGCLSDRLAPAHRVHAYGAGLVLAGVSCILSVLCHSYSTLMLFAAVYGCSVSAYLTLGPILLIEIIGLDLLATAFGILLFAQGTASLLGPPLAGWMLDMSGSFALPFYTSGVLISSSGAILLLAPLFKFSNQKFRSVFFHLGCFCYDPVKTTITDV